MGPIFLNPKKVAQPKFDSWGSKTASRQVFRRQITLPKISPPPVPPGLPLDEDPRLPIPVSSLGMPPLPGKPKASGIYPVPISPTAPSQPGLLSTNIPKDKQQGTHAIHCRAVGDCLQ
jgi:hypothetical protein